MPKPQPAAVLTIGHSTRRIEEFIRLWQARSNKKIVRTGSPRNALPMASRGGAIKRAIYFAIGSKEL